MSKKQHPSTINIFLADGDPDGLRIIGKSHWTGKGIVFSRSGYKEASTKREEFQKTGVYVLVGESEDSSLPLVYIGEGEPVKHRLDRHYADKDFWNWGVFFVSSDNSLNKAHVKNLESLLIQLVEKTKRAKLENAVGSKAPTLTEWEAADVESFLSDMLNIFPLIGLNAFKKPRKRSGKASQLTLSTPKISAKGEYTKDGFVVLKGSQSVKTPRNSSSQAFREQRKNLIQIGVLAEDGDGYVFTQDYTFASPSAAAAAVLGGNENGLIRWKTAEGKTLKQLQQEQVADSIEEV